MAAMMDPTESSVDLAAAPSVPSDSAVVTDETTLVETFGRTLEISQESTGRATSQDGQTSSSTAAQSSESKWTVGAQCTVVWSEDKQMYPATVLSLDGERCRVRFDGYGNEEDVDVSTLQSPGAPPTERQSSQDWSPGSQCRAVYSEDGLVYPAVVLWVKGQRCRVRFDNYNNEEEQDVSGLLSPDELHGPNRTKGGVWRSTNSERRRGRRSPWRDDQSVSWGKDRSSHQVKSQTESDDRQRGNKEADKPTNQSFCLFPPFPPPASSASVEPPTFIPPPPLWMFGGKDSSGTVGSDPASNMLRLWYMCGYHTGSYMAQQRLRSTSKD